jgi:hypothetical protein
MVSIAVLALAAVGALFIASMTFLFAWTALVRHSRRQRS